MSTIVLIAGGLVFWRMFSLWSSWQRNIAEAKKTGLPYVVAPFSPTSLSWRLLAPLITPVIQCLPKKYWETWLHTCTADYFFATRCEWFDRWGDTTVVATPGSLDVFTQNAEVIRQVTKRAEHFPKMKSLYEVLLQFGNNVVALEGALWRVHRRAMSASFNEKNTAFAFHESVHQARGMVRQWARSDGPITTLEEDVKRYALNVIGYVGYGIRLLWPDETMPKWVEERFEKFTSLEPREGHTMSFVDGMSVMMEHLIMLMAIPKWLFPILPFRVTRDAFRAYKESMRYLNELLDERIRQIGEGSLPDKGMDVVGQLAKTSYGPEGAKDPSTFTALSRDDILGNAVVMLIAGHETSAATLHLTLVLLAMNPSSQRRLQQDVDRLVGAQDPSEWDYEKLVNPMMASMLAACVHETLRLVSPASGLPKAVAGPGPQRITRDGASHALPAGCGVLLVSISSHACARYWPSERSRQHPERGDDLLDYVPERWFRGTLKEERERERAERRAEEEEEEEEEDYGGWRGRDTNEHLFRPERGSYIPFADGPRACLGRRVAQVELVAALAVIFREYSVELAVDECMGGQVKEGQGVDEALDTMGRGARRALYGMARERAERVLQSLKFIIAVRLPKGKHVPIRLRKRGEEKFVSWIGDEE